MSSFQALVVTLAGMLRRKYNYYDAYVEDTVEDTERGGRALRISDRMDLVTGTTEQDSEEVCSGVHYWQLYCWALFSNHGAR